MQGFTRITERLSDADVRSVLRDIVSRFRWGTFTWDPPSIAASTRLSASFTTADDPVFTGLRVGQFVALVPPAGLDAGLDCYAVVEADDTLTVRVTNVTTGAIDAASGTWSIFGVLF